VATVVADDLYHALAPLLSAHGLDLVDVEVRSRDVAVFVDREGGVDFEALAEANRIVSSALDELDPFPGRYTLEVSSPGLERRLRRPEHFARAVGETVTVRTLPGADVPRRLHGTLVSNDDSGFTLEGPEVPDGSLRLGYADVERARTVFEWAPAAKPGKAPGAKRGKTATTKVAEGKVTTP